MSGPNCDRDITIPPGPICPRKDGALAVVDDFEIIRPLGAGGFGTVYLAKDTTSDIEVALKVIGKDRKSAFGSFGWKTLPKGTGAPAGLEDELRENFKLIHGLTHPHIAVAYPLHLVRSVKKPGDGVFIVAGDILSVMAYAPGVTLDKWRMMFEGGCVPEKLAVGIVTQIASALDYAHENGVIHRDVKPSNVMVETRKDGNPFVRLLDFGLATAVGGGRGVCGTPKYMSPEQWDGGMQDKRTDQYSLAVLTCELLTGHVPLEDVFESKHKDDQANDGQAVDVSREAMRIAALTRKLEYPKGLSSRRRKVIAKAMARLPDDRYATCGKFAAALDSRPLIPFGKSIMFAVLAVSVGLALFLCPGKSAFTPAKLQIPDQEPNPPPVHEHDFGEWQTDCEARCESMGRQTRTCHAPGCTKPPVMQTREIRPLGHAWGEWRTVELAQPGIAGKEKRVCTRCTVEESRAIPALPVPGPVPHVHGYGGWNTVASPSCVRAGKEMRICQNAGCTQPPTSETRNLPALGHDWSEWSVMVRPQAGIAGEGRRVCRRCHEEEKRQVDPLPLPQPPTLQVKATLNGREVSGAIAKAHFGDEFRLPWTLQKLRVNDRIKEHFVSYYDRVTGRSYRGWFGMDVDWTGAKHIVVELEEGTIDDYYVRHGYKRRNPWRETADNFSGGGVPSDD